VKAVIERDNPASFQKFTGSASEFERSKKSTASFPVDKQNVDHVEPASFQVSHFDQGSILQNLISAKIKFSSYF
jgi:hypothetical protein